MKFLVMKLNVGDSVDAAYVRLDLNGIEALRLARLKTRKWAEEVMALRTAEFAVAVCFFNDADEILGDKNWLLVDEEPVEVRTGLEETFDSVIDRLVVFPDGDFYWSADEKHTDEHAETWLFGSDDIAELERQLEVDL